MDDNDFKFIDEFENNSDSEPSKDEISNFFDEQITFPKTFDAYPKKYQQIALDREKLIIFIEKNINGGWTEKNLRPLLKKAKSYTNIKIPNWRQLVNWKKIYFESDKSLISLIPKHASRKKNKLKTDTEDLVQKAIKTKYLTKEKLNVSIAYSEYEKLVEDKNKELGSDKIKPICRMSFYHRVNELPAYEVMKAREGKAQADKEHRLVKKILPATYLMEYVEIDHTPAPVILLDDKLETPIGRPNLTLLYDRYSASIVGLYVTFEPPSYKSARNAILNAVLPKDWVKERYPDVENDWPCHGQIKHIVVDNGAEFWSNDFEEGLRTQCTHIRYCKTARPWEKPNIEKAFDIFYQKLFSRFPGKTFKSPAELGDYNPKKDAVVRFSTFMALLHIQIIDIYQRQSDSRNKRIPYLRWQEANEMPVQYDKREAERMRIDLGKTDLRLIRKDGIHIHNLRYQSDELVQFRKDSSAKNNKKKKIIKTDPADISHIYVYLDDEKEYLKVPNVGEEDYVKGKSLSQHETIHAVRTSYIRLHQDDISLREAERKIDRRIDEEIAKASKKSNSKTSNLSAIARYQNVNSEQNSSIVQPKKSIPESKKQEPNNQNNEFINFSDVEDY